jgi:ketosteroid isomerase-like protein
VSSANVELVRSIFAAWERGDFSSTEWAHPEMELVQVDGPDPGSWTGLAAVGAHFRSGLSALDEFRAVGEEYRALDEERVLVFHRRTGRGKKSGIDIGQVNAEGANVFHVLRGKVTKIFVYWDRERALADVGLAP